MSSFVVGVVLLSAALHASWNLLARSHSPSDIFLRVLIVTAVFGLPFAFAGELVAPPVLTVVWTILPIAAFFQSTYFWGLSHGYQSGDFAVVYPLSRSLPVLLVALADLLRGHAPSPLGWLGLSFVAVGCLLIPLRSLRDFTPAHYWTRSVLWAAVTALSIVGYTVFDSAANQRLQGGAASALSYNVYETALTLLGYVLILKLERRPVAQLHSRNGWGFPVVAAVLIFGSYSLNLWAFQLTPFASYVSAIRQVSIVIGAIVGAYLFKEPSPLVRIGAASIVVIGVVCIAFA